VPVSVCLYVCISPSYLSFSLYVCLRVCTHVFDYKTVSDVTCFRSPHRTVPGAVVTKSAWQIFLRLGVSLLYTSGKWEASPVRVGLGIVGWPHFVSQSFPQFSFAVQSTTSFSCSSTSILLEWEKIRDIWLFVWFFRCTYAQNTKFPFQSVTWRFRTRLPCFLVTSMSA